MTTHISHIFSNIKKGVDSELGPKTLVVGPNGAGKTSLINAIELALCQQVTDLVGKSVVKRPSDLIRLTSDKKLEVQCSLADGKIVEVQMNRTSTGASKPKVKGKIKGCMPYLEVRNALSGSVEGLRDWLMTQGMGGSVVRKDILDLLPAEHHIAYKRAVGRRRLPELVLLRNAIESNKEAIRACRDEMRTGEKAIDHISGTLGREPTVGDLTKAATAHNRIKEVADHLAEKWVKHVSFRVTPEEIASLRQQAVASIRELQGLEEQLNRVVAATHLSPGVTKQELFALKLREEIKRMCAYHLEKQAKGCLVCGGELGDLSAKIEMLEQANTDLREIVALHEKADALEAQIMAYRKEARKLVAELQTKEKVIAGAGTPPTKERVTEARETASEAQRVHDQLLFRAEQWGKLRQDRDVLEGLKERLETLKEYGKALGAVGTGVLEGAKSSFITKVQSYLPSSFEFGFVLEEKSAQIGMLENGVLRTALSGAEWATMIMALTAATVNGNYDTVVVTPEERAFDPQTLSGVMTALQTSEFQVILTSTVAPTTVPEGWTVVEVG